MGLDPVQIHRGGRTAEIQHIDLDPPHRLGHLAPPPMAETTGGQHKNLFTGRDHICQGGLPDTMSIGDVDRQMTIRTRH